MDVSEGVMDKKLQQVKGHYGTQNKEGQGEFFAEGLK